MHLTEEINDRLDQYNRSTDAETKKKHLDELIATDPSEANLFRRLVWEKRFTKNGKITGEDAFLNSFIALNFQQEQLTSFLGHKRAAKEVGVIYDQFMLSDHLEDYQKEVLYQEYRNLVSIYVQLCRHDPKYRSMILGLGTLKEEDLSYKLAKDLYRIVCGAPRLCNRAEDFRLLSVAARDSFYSYFPDDKDSWDLARKDFEKQFRLS